MAEKIRLFFALPIPGEICRGLTAERKRIASDSLRWTAPANLHFTLRFLGEVEEGRVAELIAAGREAARGSQPFTLQIRGSGFFPDERKPRILWVGTGEGSENIVLLAGNLSAELGKIGFPSEERPFLPHLTVARIVVGQASRLSTVGEGFHPLPSRMLESWKDRDFGSFLVGEFCLMKSTLLPSGAIYDKIHSFPLIPPP